MKYLYNFLKLIPKDKIITYKQLGEIFNIHPRKVARILRENTQQDIYPCYKVVNSNLEIGGYNLGTKEKIKRLKNCKIDTKRNKIHKNHLRNPKLKNFFCAFPLEGEQVNNFKAMINELSKINNGSFSLQKETTPHITLSFFGNISLKEFHQIITDSQKLKIEGKKYITFGTLNNFYERIYFLKPSYEKYLLKTYQEFNKINNFKQENRIYQPHLTIARIKNKENFQKIKKQFEEIVSNYSFWIKINKIRFYLAVDKYFQIPIKDISLT